MKTLWAIFLVLMVGIGVRAQSSGFPDQRFQVEQSFVVEQLSSERLSGFEFRAKQQLADFANYISLISNPDYAPEMRQHAYKLALALFDRPDCPLSGVACNGKCTVKSFLEGLLSSKTQATWTVSEVQRTQALTSDKQGYLGRLRFVCRRSDGSSQTAEVAVILKKLEKRFGDQREWVWEVRLGEMQRRP